MMENKNSKKSIIIIVYVAAIIAAFFLGFFIKTIINKEPVDISQKAVIPAIAKDSGFVNTNNDSLTNGVKQSDTSKKSSAFVTATQMNVFYIGVENPVDIYVPGVADENVSATISSGTIKNNGLGAYTVIVTDAGKKTTITVTAIIGGKSKVMGSTDFRIKRVPDPVAYIANVNYGAISKSLLAASTGIIAKMKDFDFELNFTITSFMLTMDIGGDLVTIAGVGNKLSPHMISLIQAAKVITKIYIEDIHATDPDGTLRTLSPISLQLTN